MRCLSCLAIALCVALAARCGAPKPDTSSPPPAPTVETPKPAPEAGETKGPAPEAPAVLPKNVEPKEGSEAGKGTQSPAAPLGQATATPGPPAVAPPTATAQTPTGTAQTPTGTAQTPTGTAQTPTGTAQTPTGTAQTPTVPAQNPSALSGEPLFDAACKHGFGLRLAAGSDSPLHEAFLALSNGTPGCLSFFRDNGEEGVKAAQCYVKAKALADLTACEGSLAFAGSGGEEAACRHALELVRVALKDQDEFAKDMLSRFMNDCKRELEKHPPAVAARMSACILRAKDLQAIGECDPK